MRALSQIPEILASISFERAEQGDAQGALDAGVAARTRHLSELLRAEDGIVLDMRRVDAALEPQTLATVFLSFTRAVLSELDGIDLAEEFEANMPDLPLERLTVFSGDEDGNLPARLRGFTAREYAALAGAKAARLEAISEQLESSGYAASADRALANAHLARFEAEHANAYAAYPTTLALATALRLGEKVAQAVTEDAQAGDVAGPLQKALLEATLVRHLA